MARPNLLLVVSDQGGGIEGYPIALANYQDLLVDQAFGNYRDLLEQVTLSPVMGHYLSMFKNRKPDPEQNIRPDENYAREIMQLFSIGLVQLNPDGTPVLAGGQPVPTYTQDTIRGFAHLFTGWNYANCPRTDGGQWWEWEWCPSGPVDWPEPGWDAYWLVPMEPWQQYHASEDSKQLLAYPGVTLSGGVLPAGGTAESNLDAALDNIFGHPNVGPFVARHLGPRDEDVAAMLSVIGKDSLDDLIATTLPSAITPSIFTPTTCCITLAVPRPCSRCWTRSS